MNQDSPIQFLTDLFKANAANPAFIFHDEEFSYDWLIRRIDYWSGELSNRGLGQGSIIAVTGDYSPDICALVLAIISKNAILVPFASVVGAEKAELEKVASVECEFLFQNGKFSNVQIKSRDTVNSMLADFIKIGDPGLVVFSSGSTGVPKGILHNFSKILDKFRTRRRALKTLTFLQLDHLGGINTLLHTLSNGGTVISVSERSPRQICAAVAKFKIELMPVTPSFLNLLLISGEHRKFDLSSLKVISYGTEVMPIITLARVREEFPDVLLQQTYGLSELGVMRTKSKDDGSLWVKIGGEGFETKIVNNTLWIKAHSAMIGYLNAPQPFDKDGWFNTEDEVEIDGDYVKILGRRSEMINVGGQKVFPSEVESVLMQMPNVKDAVVMGEKHMIMGNIVIAKLLLDKSEDANDLKTRVRMFCRDRLSSYKVPMKVEIVSDELYNSRFKRVRTNRPAP
jgi:long-chain acyl-CoA synthetase